MRRGLLIVLFAAGCSSGTTSNKPLENPPDTPATSQRCRDLDTQLKEAVAAAGGSCATDADCKLIAGQLGTGTQTCACAAFIGDCGGVPMPSNAPGIDRLNMLIEEFDAAGCASGIACDCGLRGPLRCSADHRCVAADQSCVDEQPTGW